MHRERHRGGALLRSVHFSQPILHQAHCILVALGRCDGTAQNGRTRLDREALEMEQKLKLKNEAKEKRARAVRLARLFRDSIGDSDDDLEDDPELKHHCQC